MHMHAPQTVRRQRRWDEKLARAFHKAWHGCRWLRGLNLLVCRACRSCASKYQAISLCQGICGAPITQNPRSGTLTPKPKSSGQDSEGDTPLHWAAFVGSATAVKALAVQTVGHARTLEGVTEVPVVVVLVVASELVVMVMVLFIFVLVNAIALQLFVLRFIRWAITWSLAEDSSPG